MLRKIIRGELHASKAKTEESSWHWNNVIHSISYNKHLRGLINYDKEWYGSESVWSLKGFKPKADFSGVIFNSPSPAWGSRQDFDDFLNALKEFIESEHSVALGLEGSLEIVTETEKFPFIFRVTVKEGKVSYQQVEHIEWSESITV